MNQKRILWVNRRGWYLPAIVVFCFVTGCSQQKLRDGYVDVRGTVKLDGDPLPNAQVVFETESGKSFARTDRNGNYVAQYNKAMKGAGTGPAIVRISTKEVFPDDDVSDLAIDPKSGDHIKPELVPEKYNRKSELQIEITDGGAPYDFELEST